MAEDTNYARSIAILEAQFIGTSEVLRAEVLRAVAYALLAMVDLVREIHEEDTVKYSGGLNDE